MEKNNFAVRTNILVSVVFDMVKGKSATCINRLQVAFKCQRKVLTQ